MMFLKPFLNRMDGDPVVTCHQVFDWLHHRIGSTHVAHHIDCTIPHYNARKATDAIAANWPKAYLYDPTPVHKAMWRVASNCLAVKLRPTDGRYTWVPL